MIFEQETPREQVTYANLLFYGCWIGIFIMVTVYGLINVVTNTITSIGG